MSAQILRWYIFAALEVRVHSVQASSKKQNMTRNKEQDQAYPNSP